MTEQLTDQEVLASEARHAREERDREAEGQWLASMSEEAAAWTLEAARFNRLTITEFRNNGGAPPKGL